LRRFFAQFVTALRASPGKASALCVLTAILIVLVGRLILHVPAGAAAGPIPVAAVIAWPNTAGAASQAAPVRVVHSDALPSEPARDPFAANWTLFPALPQPVTAETQIHTSEHPTLQDRSARFADLTVSLTVLDGQAGRRAVIGDRVVTTGDTFDGARVEEIGPRYVVLSDGEHRFVLRMKASR